MHNSFHRVGHGPHPVIVLHGWFGDAHAFDAIEPWLTTGHFSYVFMDYRGYGGMQDAAGNYTIDEIAADTIALADALGFASFSLVGHSMGGTAIEKIAALVPQRVRALVALAPVPGGGIAFAAATRALFEAAADSIAHRKAIIDRSTGHRLPSSWIAWKAAYSAACSSATAFAAYFRAWADSDSEDYLGGLHPLLVVVGEHDPAFTADLMTATYLRRYPHAALEVMNNAGHYPMNETPLALVALMEQFLLDTAVPPQYQAATQVTSAPA